MMVVAQTRLAHNPLNKKIWANTNEGSAASSSLQRLNMFGKLVDAFLRECFSA